MNTLGYDIGLEALHCNTRYSGMRFRNDESDDVVNTNQGKQWRPRRHRRDTYHTHNGTISTRMTACRFVALLAMLSALMDYHTCSAIEDTASSFQRPPPPPPPPASSFSARTTEEENWGQGYDNHDQQQERFPSPPSQYQDDFYNANGEDEQGLRQPDPSTPQAPQKPPIHYEFPMAENDDFDTNSEEGLRYRNDNNRFDNDDMSSPTSSARTDVVTRYWSTKIGKAQIQTVVGLLGYGSGSFVAKSMFGNADMVQWTGYIWAIFLVISTWFRTPLGELSRAMGLSLILVLQRTQRIRKEYPTWRYAAASVGMIRGGPRDARGKPRGPRPFPPARNPWNYSPRSPRDPDFNMIYTLISMAIVGSTVGGNMPFIPNWIGALVGAASFAFACTWQNSHRGDLVRTMGMRVVRAVSELWEIQADLQIIPKATVVSSNVIDKAMVLDRKHRVKDRFLSFANKGYAQASKVAEQIQRQQRGGEKNDRNDGERNRDRRGYRNRGDRREEEDDRMRRDDRVGDMRRYSRHRGSDRENDQGDDDNRQRRRSRYDEDEDDDDGRYKPPSRSGSYGGRQEQRQYDDKMDGRDLDMEEFHKDEDEKKSKGFFFRRK